jgi:hypothetical protein
MRDFTLNRYQDLLDSLRIREYTIQPDLDLDVLTGKNVILRHDVDALPYKALAMSRVEQKSGIRSSFFFKIRQDVFLPDVIREIASDQHIIGYHYEDLVRNHGNYSKAISDFERNLEAFRKIVPVTRICADGTPLSRYNNLWLWDKYDYKKFGIESELYLDLDYDKSAYYTDTGRCWDGDKYNVWDRVICNTSWPTYHETRDMIRAIIKRTFPVSAVVNVHPQRWKNNLFEWSNELIMQNLKNKLKLGFVYAMKDQHGDKE